MRRYREWFNPARPLVPSVITDQRERRGVAVELVVVFTITLGLSGARSLLSFTDSLLRPEPLDEQEVTLHAPQATLGLLDMAQQLLGVLQLLGWAALGLYLLWRAGIKLASIGIDASKRGKDLLAGIALTALIGIPGLALYLAGWWLGFNLAVVPSTLDETWWRPITLTLSAFGNGAAEEILVVGYLLTRLRQLGFAENSALAISAAIRGVYHLYQGIGGFVGNVIMGVVFGRIWQRTNRLWPLIIAHTLLDIVAFVGYALVREVFPWLP